MSQQYEMTIRAEGEVRDKDGNLISSEPLTGKIVLTEEQARELLEKIENQEEQSRELLEKLEKQEESE